MSKPANRLLSALPSKTLDSLRPHLSTVDLDYGHVLYDLGSPIRTLYFPEKGVVSLLAAVDDKTRLEVGVVGIEGMVGLQLFLGKKTSDTRAVVQGAGTALSIKATPFLAECSRSDDLPRVLRSFTHALMGQISQTAACNHYHRIEPRLARWLLMSHDRMGVDEFRLTQEFLSNMLGVRREAVSRSAAKLRDLGAMSYNRGIVNILDRTALESAACSCYQIIAPRRRARPI